eukprot:756957-Hanusia_phi.AAC.1
MRMCTETPIHQAPLSFTVMASLVHAYSPSSMQKLPHCTFQTKKSTELYTITQAVISMTLATCKAFLLRFAPNSQTSTSTDPLPIASSSPLFHKDLRNTHWQVSNTILGQVPVSVSFSKFLRILSLVTSYPSSSHSTCSLSLSSLPPLLPVPPCSLPDQASPSSTVTTVMQLSLRE